jgi:hypothetical protein
VGSFNGTLEDGTFPPDLTVYLDAGNHYRDHEDLYLQGSLEYLETHYLYAPIFALLFVPFTWIDPGITVIIHTLLHLIAYIVLYIWWDRIFSKLKLKDDCARDVLAWTLPVWLIFNGFWGDLYYLNIYIPMALVGTWFIEAIIDQRLGWSVFWLVLILQIKPHWAFAAAIPLLLGQYRFFGKLLAWTLPLYVLIIGLFIVVAGPDYGINQHREYVEFLGRLTRDYPWRGSDLPYLGYNHSIRQTMYYYFGISDATFYVTLAIKVLLLIPLGLTGLRYLRHPHHSKVIGLEWAFALYLGVFIWLDVVWEITLGIAVFTYLLSVIQDRRVIRAVWVIFMIYALGDVIQFLSYSIEMASGIKLMDHDAYVLTDPNIYIPATMLVIVLFYGILVTRLWVAADQLEESSWTFKPFKLYPRRKLLE